MSKKEWLNPELKDLELSKTNTEVDCESQESDSAKCLFYCKYGQQVFGCGFRKNVGTNWKPKWVCTYTSAGDGTENDNMGVTPLS